MTYKRKRRVTRRKKQRGGLFLGNMVKHTPIGKLFKLVETGMSAARTYGQFKRQKGIANKAKFAYKKLKNRKSTGKGFFIRDY